MFLQKYQVLLVGKAPGTGIYVSKCTWRIQKNVPTSLPITPMWSFQLAFIISRSTWTHCVHIVPWKRHTEWPLFMAKRHLPI